MTTVTTEVETTRKLLHAADTDIAAFFDYFSDDCIFRMGNNAPVIGKDSIQSWVAQYLTSVASMRHEIIEQWSAGNVAALRVEVTYTLQSGEFFTLPAVTRTRVEQNKVTEYLIFMDPSPVISGTTQ
ncbi:nuclear transport factor 2 family protein (plasmid) [Rhodococcus sp. USK10]|uniref:nuclear transport factor 2 family protein n=1 Tax=Rhodococcus sp. USK10 TaxID=2789739 RepID=UPI001C5CE807|nr:nuclear transport factor 2 family protein [Rhodococcus sp. USK10]QYA99821.1 nuclear transport factor 2 family protein [Rhodococcus sp. USK10]